MKHKFINDSNRDDIIQMLFEAQSEIAFKLNDSEDNPVSLSLFLLELGVTDSTVETKLLQMTTKMVLAAEDPMKLTVIDFQKEFHKISPQIKVDPESPAVVRYILKWVGLRIPFVYPVAMNI